MCGGGGGGGGGHFYKIVWVTERSLEAKEPLDAKFRYD